MSAKRQVAWIVAVAGLLALGRAHAGGSAAEIKKAMKEKKGTYYLRTNVPYYQGRHAYGTFKRAIVTVSPSEGVKTGDAAEVQAGLFHAEGRRLVLRVNDPVKVDEFEWDDDENALDIELEGTGRAGEGDGVIRFTNLSGVGDFDKCWKESFSDVSIETKYDWPDEIKKAVVQREIREGMTKEQALVALGNPDRVTRTTDQGRSIEIWQIQRGEGAKMGFWSMKMGDRKEMEIKFVDGKVADIGGDDAKSGVKLK
jgi:hypothetical protein